MKFSSLVPSVVAAAGIAVASSAFSPAQALTLTGNVSCSTSNLTGSVDCEGAYEGNDANQDLSSIFGGPGWSELFKVDSDSGSDGGLTVTGGGTSGGWSLTGVDTSNLMIVLKGGPSFSAYKLNGATSGTWNTQGIETGGGQPGPGLSHFTVYKPVPEPLTILGSATALGIGGLLKRQQSKKNNKA